MPDIGWYGLVLVVAAAATAALTVPAKRIALRVGYVAHPGERTVHKKPIPYGGGASMFVGFLVAVLAAACVPQLRDIFHDSPEMLGVVLAAGAMFAVGLIDDVRDMSAPAKMAGQVLAASILYFFGVTMYELKIPLAGFYLLTPGIIPLITAIWVIALDQRGQPDRRARRAGRRRRRDRQRHARHLRHPSDGARPDPVRQRRPARRRHRVRHLSRLPALQLQPGAHLHGRRRRALPRSAHGRVHDGDRRPRPYLRAHLRRDLLLLRPPVHPALHPRRPARRHGVRVRAPHGAAARGSTRPTRSTSTTAWCASATARGAASSSCGPGRRCSRASCSSRSSCTR